VPSLAGDLRLALDQVSFASSLGLDPDPWQERLLRSTSPRVLLNCSRQSGKSTMSGVIALHRALYFPGSGAVPGAFGAPVQRVVREGLRLL
jgi:hypothetical protein